MQLQGVADFYPLSPLQEGLLFHTLSDAGSGAYFNQTLVSFEGDLDVSAFRSAWQGAIARHPILRTFFVWEGVERAVQVVKEKATMPFDVLDWRELAPEERSARVDALRAADLERGFDLSSAPLMRAVLIQVDDQRHDFLWSFHHILMDGWSMFHVLREIFDSYDAANRGATATFDASRPYRDYIAWLHRQSLPKAEVFWRKTLAGFTAPTPLPAELAGDEERPDFDVAIADVSAETTAALQQLTSTHRLTLNTILLGSWALLLARYSGEDDVVFGTVVSGRPPELDGVHSMVGLFINTLPVRARMRTDLPLAAWLQDLQSQQAEAREYEYSPLVEIQGWSEAPRGSALFDSIFLFENYHKEGSLEELSRTLEIRDIQWFERHNYPLAAVAIPGERMSLRLIHDTSRFSTETMERMLDHWRVLLEGMARDAGTGLLDLPILTPSERSRYVDEWSGSSTDYPRDRCIHQLFEDQVRATPDAVAVSFEGRQWTYAELNRRSNQLAHRLRDLGVGPEVQVGMCTERSLEMIVALLGTLKAGGAYVALDPDYPADRLAFMLGETGAPVLLTQENLAGRLPATDAHVIRLDADWESVAGESEEDPENLTTAENLAYVIFTSGSTGKPKGTCIPHRAVVRLVVKTDFAELTRDEVFLQFATVSFDASTLELWGSLLNGARLAVFPAGKASLEDLSRVVRDDGVTVLWLTAGLFHQMMEHHPEGLRGVRQLLAGGDVLSVPHVKKALDQLEGCKVINGYGPTENTTFTCCHTMTRSEDVGRTVPIGRPIANTTVYIVDSRMEPVPVGVAGDLFTGGDGLARGYLDHPALTAERFVPDPFGDSPGGRLYRTGDRARYLPDGTIEFLGRNDFQVKVRGFRIELGEIEITLSEHPSVKDSVVMARDDASGDKRLVAYLVCDTGSRPSNEELRSFLLERVPDHMAPSTFVVLDSFPLTANGKVDRRALPEPDLARPDLDTAYAAPRAGIEEAISGIWQEVLDLQQVGVHDNFFDLGGHSLHLIRVHGKLKEELGRDIAMVTLFKYPTISALGRHLEGEGPTDSAPTEDAQAKVQAGKDRLRGLRERRRK